jgi:acyl dehydratase
MRTITGLAELRAAEGEVLGASDWHEITQDAVNGFADVTGDHQWIHVDVERARSTPFGGTIAHGYFTLSLAPMLTAEVVAFEGFTFAINYGLDRVRFPAPMPVGDRVRASVKLAAVEDVSGGAQISLEITFERDGGDRPVCVARTLARLYAGDSAASA